MSFSKDSPSKGIESPGNAYSSIPTNMRRPYLEFLYRLEAKMAPEDIEIGAPFGSGMKRIIMNILGGTLKGPGLEGNILEHGGADWGTSIEGTGFMRLDARYTIRMIDGHHIFVRANGVFHPRTGSTDLKETLSQDDVDWFTSVQIEAGSDGPYNWMNSLAIVGVLSMVDSRIFIDTYRLTNFPGAKAPSCNAKI